MLRFILTPIAWVHVTFFDAEIWAARLGLWKDKLLWRIFRF